MGDSENVETPINWSKKAKQKVSGRSTASLLSIENGKEDSQIQVQLDW